MAKRLAKKQALVVAPSIEPLIRILRNQRVILDSDLARIYGVSTKVLNQAVKRNADRFPNDFVIQLTRKEWEGLRSQIVTSNTTRGGRRYTPQAFTEHGAVMAANVLNSHLAITMSVYVVRAFVKLREVLVGYKELREKLDEIERKLTGRQEVHEKAILQLFKQMKRITDSPAPVKASRQIGFRTNPSEK